MSQGRTHLTAGSKETFKAYAAWGAVCLFWGTTYLAIRIGVRTLPPALFAGIRFFVAGAVFLAYLKIRGVSLPDKRELLNIAIVGILLLVIANGCVVWAEQWVPSGLAALIVATLPFWVSGIEAIWPSGNRLNIFKILGIAIGFFGLVILFAPALKSSLDQAYLKGVLALLFAPLSWALGSVYAKYHPTRTAPLMAAALQMVIAGIILMFIGVILNEVPRFDFNLEGLAALVYLAIFGSIIGYGSFIYALAKLPAAKVSMYAYVNPIIAVLLGWLILGEQLDWRVAIATAVILLGVVLVQSARA
ncbi:MAG TPA: EamA family transporter [Thermodesulfobacteriota bacterium]|jgi:drug/metabolite transporter (DMT)-like permease